MSQYPNAEQLSVLVIVTLLTMLSTNPLLSKRLWIHVVMKYKWDTDNHKENLDRDINGEKFARLGKEVPFQNNDASNDL